MLTEHMHSQSESALATAVGESCHTGKKMITFYLSMIYLFKILGGLFNSVKPMLERIYTLALQQIMI